jgi:hypothetical protein
VSALGVDVSPNPDTIESAQLNQPMNRQYTLSNTFRAFNGRATGTGFGSARIDRPSIAHHAASEFPIEVLPGSTQLRAKIGNPSDLGSDLDLLLQRCTTGTCVTVASSTSSSSEELVTVANPAAGAWKVIIDGYSVPAGTTSYDYLDIFTGGAFGSIAVTDANADRPAGSSWTVTGVVTPGIVPAAGRVLLGNIEVRTDANVLVGTGEVIVRSVT